MSSQPTFDFTKPRTPKNVDDASREVYQSIVLPNLTERQAMVLRALDRYSRMVGGRPTAYELLEYMRETKPELDVNNVRPRLTEMRKGDLRFVEWGEKRVCRVKRTPAHTLILTPRGEAYLRDKK